MNAERNIEIYVTAEESQLIRTIGTARPSLDQLRSHFDNCEYWTLRYLQRAYRLKNLMTSKDPRDTDFTDVHMGLLNDLICDLQFLSDKIESAKNADKRRFVKECADIFSSQDNIKRILRDLEPFIF